MRSSLLGSIKRVLLPLFAVGIVHAQEASSGFVPLNLRVIPDATINGGWKVIRAELSESAIGVWGQLDVQNVSRVAAAGVRFYAEYLDAQGRTCLTLVFSGRLTARHLGNDNAPFWPGETRELLTPGPGLGPAVQPVQVRVSLVGEQPLNEPWHPVSGDNILRSPVTINATVPQTTLRLRLDESERAATAVDLAFARITVDADGVIQAIDVLNVFNAESKDWFDAFLRLRGIVRPATRGLANSPGTALLLIRVLNDPDHPRAPGTLPRNSAWVKAYTKRDDVTPITQLLFSPSNKLTPAAMILPDGTFQPAKERSRDPELFEYISAGSSWCAEILSWKPSGATAREVLTWATSN